MARNTATFIVDVVTKGLKPARDAIAGVGKNAREAAAGYNAANTGAKDFYNTQAKGVIGTANSTKSFSKLAETMNGGGGGIVGAYATLAANIFAVSAAFNALRSAAQVQQVLEGLNASGARMGLTLSVAADRVQSLSGGLLSAEQAMRSTAQVMAAGFGTGDLENLTKIAKDVSFALGRNMTDSMDRLTRGVVKLEPELLDELGLMTKLTESSANYALQLGKSVTSLTSFEKRQGFLNAIVAEGKLKFDGLSESAGNTTAFDKVAAQFSNLTKTIFNAVNVAFIPMAAIFGSSPTGLVGLMLLLGSTISRQLMPGLTNFSGKAKEAATNARNLARDNLAGFRQTAKDLTNHKTYIDNVIAGNVSIQERTAYIEKLNTKLEKQDSILSKIEEKQRIAAETGKTARLTKVEQRYSSFESGERYAVEAEIRDRLQRELQAGRKANARDLAATGIANAGNGQALTGLIQIRQAMQEHSKVVNEAGKASGAFSKALFNVGTAAQFTGATFLRMLPWIGIIVTAVGMIKGIIENNKSTEQKNYEAKVSDLNKILDASADKVREFNRLQASTGNSAAAASAAIVLQSNAVHEIAEAYRDLQAAKSSYDREAERTNTGKGFFAREWEEFKTGFKGEYDDVIVSKNVGIDRGSEVFKNFRDVIENEAVKSLDKLRLVAPETYNQVIKLAGGFEAIRRMTPEKKIEMATNAIENMDKILAPAADAVKNLEMQLKALDEAFSAFFVSAAPSTPYDKIVDGITSVNTAIFEMNKVMGDNFEKPDWKVMLTKMGPEIERMLSVQTRLELDRYKATEQTTAALKEQLKTAKDIFEAGSLRGSIAEYESYLRSQEGILVTLQLETLRMEDQFVLAQKISREAQAQLAIAQTQMSANSRNYEITAEGLAARFKDEERIAQIQIEQLKAQQLIFKQRIAQNALSTKEIEIYQEINNYQKLRGLLDEQNARRQAVHANTLRKLEMERVYYSDNTVSAFEQNQLDLQQKYIDNAKASYDALTQKVDTYQAARQKTLENADAMASVQAFASQIDNILAGLNTASEKAAAIAAKTADILRDRLGQLGEQRKQLQETINIERKLIQVRSGRPATLSAELGYMREQFVLTVATAKQQYTSARNKLAQDRAQSLAENATTQAQKDARTSAVAFYDTQIELLDQGHHIQLRQLGAAHQLAEAEKLMFDTRKEGLDIQRESLDYVNKALDAAKELRGARDENSILRDEIDQKRKGVQDNEALSSARQIKAASAAYRYAVEEAGIRKMMVDLEFALLAAQKEVLKEQLRDRKIAMAGRDPVADAQLAAAISNLDSINVSGIAQNLKRAIDEGVENSRLNLIKEIIPNRSSSAMLSNIEGIRRQASERAAAEALLRNPPQPIKVAAELVVAPALAQRTDAQLSATNGIVVANEKLIAKINQWITVVEKALGAMPSALTPNIDTTGAIAASVTAGNVKVAMDYFLQKGWSPAQAAGIVGNLQAESGKNLNTRAIGDNGLAMGIAQWRTDMKSGARALKFKEIMGIDVLSATIHKQLEFVQWELENTHKAAAVMLRQATDPARAADIFEDKYEGSHRTAGGVHAQNARRLVTTGANDNVPAALTSVAAPTNTPELNAALAYKGTALELLQIVDTAPQVVEAFLAMETPIQGANIQLDELIKSAHELETIQAPTDFTSAIGLYAEGINRLRAGFEQLGPEGQVMLQFMDGIKSVSTAVNDNLATISNSANSMGTRVVAATEIASAAVTMVQGVLKASADARIASVDREIAAEQRRDGKSAESVAKIQSLEKKKDSIARKSFNMNKKLMMAQAVISTAAAVAGQLASPPVGPWNIALAAVMGAFGAAQLAIIAGTQYQSTANANFDGKSMPSTLTIGKRGDGVDVARHNANAGGELAYLRGRPGIGSNSSNYAPIGSAYGGPIPRGYGHSAFVVGEKGPEIIERDTPINVRPMNENNDTRPMTAHFHIDAFDGESVENMLRDKRGNIIDMLREAANANGTRFLEDVKTSHYKKANASGATRI